MTLDEASGRWWAEVGIHRGDRADVERRLTALLKLIGNGQTLAGINQATVSAAIQKRKGIGCKRGAAKDAKVYYPSAATVNRDVIETLRPILRRARTHWTSKESAHGLPEIDWRSLRMSEPRGLSRTYSAQEQGAWLDHAEKLDVDLALEVMLAYGLRLGELMFELDQIGGDPDRPVLTLQKGRKRDVRLEVPLTQEHGRALMARAARARKAKLDTVWYLQQGKNRNGSERLVPMTYAMMEYRLSKAADLAGIAGGRRIHGARHHAATAILRDTQNIKAVQTLLGHASITSSQRYAHVLTDDLRNAIEGRTKPVRGSGTTPGLHAPEVPEVSPSFPIAGKAGKSRKARGA